jgi:hypothetical protein
MRMRRSAISIRPTRRVAGVLAARGHGDRAPRARSRAAGLPQRPGAVADGDARQRAQQVLEADPAPASRAGRGARRWSAGPRRLQTGLEGDAQLAHLAATRWRDVLQRHRHGHLRLLPRRQSGGEPLLEPHAGRGPVRVAVRQLGRAWRSNRTGVGAMLGRGGQQTACCSASSASSSSESRRACDPPACGGLGGFLPFLLLTSSTRARLGGAVVAPPSCNGCPTGGAIVAPPRNQRWSRFRRVGDVDQHPLRRQVHAALLAALDADQAGLAQQRDVGVQGPLAHARVGDRLARLSRKRSPRCSLATSHIARRWPARSCARAGRARWGAGTSGGSSGSRPW